MAEDPKKAIGRRLREARMAAGLSREQLGYKLKVHPGSIARWETGGAVPHPFHLERIAELTQTSPAWLQYGTKETSSTKRKRVRDHDEANEIFTSFDAVVRFLGGLGSPGEQKARKIDALEGYRRMISTLGAVPEWWYELKERVDRSEL